MKKENEALFQEVQYFRQLWVWIIITIVTALAWWGFVQQVIFRQTFGSKPASDTELIILWVLFGILFPVMLYSLRLITLVKPNGIYFRFFPFHFSYCKIPITDLRKYEIRTYNPIKEYGGWGIRVGPNGKAYNISGNIGMQLILKDSNRILIGTQKPEEFIKAIDLVVSQGKDQRSPHPSLKLR